MNARYEKYGWKTTKPVFRRPADSAKPVPGSPIEAVQSRIEQLKQRERLLLQAIGNLSSVSSERSLYEKRLAQVRSKLALNEQRLREIAWQEIINRKVRDRFV